MFFFVEMLFRKAAQYLMFRSIMFQLYEHNNTNNDFRSIHELLILIFDFTYNTKHNKIY